MKFEAYPIQFNPILKDKIWGGDKLKTVFHKPIETETTGESWEISGVKGDISEVSNGIYAGKNLNELLDLFPEAVLGKAVHEKFGTDFPLLFKFIDAKEDLSIQVHPNDELAQKRHHSFGKTEMWYIMQADPGSRLIVGFKEDSNASEYIKNLENKTLLSILDEVPVGEGDAFFLETGTIHAIGAGIVLAEIQQTSDITYRIYDWDRVDAEGKGRELHTELALEAMNYSKTATQRKYSTAKNQSNSIVDCKYFTTNIIPLDGKLEVVRSTDSFTVYMCVDGNFELHWDNGVQSYGKGDTILIPAYLDHYTLEGNASLLEIYIS